MAPRLVVFCGKGGVGKSTLAVASGLSLSRRGRRTLVVSSHPLPELALSISLEGLEQEDPEAAARFFVVHIDPRKVVDGLVRSNIRPARIADLLVDNRVYRNFVEVVPGLKEFAFLWRLTDLGTAPRGQADGYDVIIWDAPATGHFLQTLRVARNFEQFFSGPLANQGGRIRDFFEGSDPFIMPICVPEEMSVDETLELESGLQELELNSRAVICNLSSPALAAAARKGGPEAAEELPDFAGLGPWASFLRARLTEEREQYLRLRKGLNGEVVVVERCPREHTDLRFLAGLAGRVADSGLLRLLRFEGSAA